ncbi:RNA polymerase sigma factor [Sphingomonas colocasiae]|nr:RNA polymerase sigma factor [Sphingomonas colocasiae]
MDPLKTGLDMPGERSGIRLGDTFLDRLYRNHAAELRGHLRRKLGNGPPDPDDVLQGAFARFAALPDREAVPNPKAYLLRTAHNLIIDARRQDGTVQRAAGTLRLIEENRADPSAEDVLSSREELERLAAIIGRLKPKERSAFLLHRIDGLNYVEIARRLNVSESGARGLVSRVLEICVKEMRR